jgi:hypothetical protein
MLLWEKGMETLIFQLFCKSTIISKLKVKTASIVVHAYNPSTQEEGRRTEFPSTTKKKNKTKKEFKIFFVINSIKHNKFSQLFNFKTFAIHVPKKSVIKF